MSRCCEKSLGRIEKCQTCTVMSMYVTYPIVGLTLVIWAFCNEVILKCSSLTALLQIMSFKNEFVGTATP